MANTPKSAQTNLPEEVLRVIHEDEEETGVEGTMRTIVSTGMMTLKQMDTPGGGSHRGEETPRSITPPRGMECNAIWTVQDPSHV